MLADLITRKSLHDLAGTSTFQRGEEYFANEAVSRVRVVEEKVSARVEGSDTYQVELWNDDGDLDYECSCPQGDEGNFCKHCVAVGLAWLAGKKIEGKSGGASGKKKTAKKRDPWVDIRTYLSSQRPELLIDLLMDVAQRDDRLYQSLLLKAERTGGAGNATMAFRRAIESVTDVDEYVDWRAAATFAANLDQVAESLAELLKPGTAAMLVELAEYAIERVEHALENIDDSGGNVSETLQRVAELHFKACKLARPDPKELAERLFRCETSFPFDSFHESARIYRGVLGDAGLQRFRELAEAEWRKIKPIASQPGDGKSYDGSRWRITHIMETLAELSGDIEQLVAIKQHDLSSSYSYLAIAEVFDKAGKKDKALEWAERGLKAFPTRMDDRLRDFLIAAYLKRKRNDEALNLTWLQFEERTGLEHYKKLQRIAQRLGLWTEQRERALALVAKVIARGAATIDPWNRQERTPDHSLRVEIALWEKDLDAAWQTAHEGICHRDLLIALAGKLEATRPADAISIYRRVVPPIVGQAHNTAYADAIKLIRKMGNLMTNIDQSREFGDYLAALHAQFKPKRNFIKLLDEVARAHVAGSKR
jgi:uncharacterized Zn finger protein